MWEHVVSAATVAGLAVIEGHPAMDVSEQCHFEIWMVVESCRRCLDGPVAAAQVSQALILQEWSLSDVSLHSTSAYDGA